MNFLAHSVVLPSDSADLTRVGSALPDLWPLVSPRPLPALVLRELHAKRDQGSADLSYGIAHHMQTDAVFHSHEEFDARVGWLAQQLRSRWPDLQQSLTYAHVLVEMLLDRWLMERDSPALDLYYHAFQPEVLAFAAEHGAGDTGASPVLRAVLDRFASTQFLRGYTTSEGLAQRFLGLTRRLPWACEWQQPSRHAELVDRIDGWHTHLCPRSGELIESVRAAVQARLGEPWAR